MSYEISEQEIQAIVKYLEHTKPEQATREYAVELVQAYQSMGAEAARNDPEMAELLQQIFPEKQEPTDA